MEDNDERRRTELLTEGFTPSPEPISNLAKSANYRLPDSLWNLAVKLVRQHGLSLTARVLQLDYYGLKKRTEEDRSQLPSLQSGFIQLPYPPPTGKQEVFELEPGTGTKLRVQVLGYDTSDLETLVRHFGNKV